MIDRRTVIAHGITWTSLFQVFLAGANLVSMLVLVRLLSPSELGRAPAATGVLGQINCFNCSYCITQALQLREGEEPDWDSHWSAGFYIQLTLFIVCNGVAAISWMFAPYRPMAPLLDVAPIGLLIDCPNQVAITDILANRKLGTPNAEFEMTSRS